MCKEVFGEVVAVVEQRVTLRSWDRSSAGGLPPGFPQVSWWVRVFSGEACCALV